MWFDLNRAIKCDLVSASLDDIMIGGKVCQ
jgi:hypothetical protein